MKPIKHLYRLVCFLFLAMIHISCMAQENPNIILLMADDIGLGDIGFYHKDNTGQEPIVPTPNIDELIALMAQKGDIKTALFQKWRKVFNYI
ncbi:hypothetical protein [Zobellia alginiliquefaciens]|uniref:hypothetical protein n=1 Tax=Zobellia alginiliquefaciens TaxID=3032586 RepID=UPI0023E3D0D2|nr:hypothetical protein [Zobellia alginiliquefaciens]